MCVKILGSSTP